MKAPLPTPPQAKSWLRRILEGVGLLALLGAVAALVYAAGGAHSGYAYLMLGPVVLAAITYGPGGGVAAGLLGGLLVGPLTPHDVTAASEHQAQSVVEWGIRLGVFVGVGALMGVWSRLLQQYVQATRLHQGTHLPNQLAFEEDLDARIRSNKPANGEIGVAVVRATDLKDLADTLGLGVGDRVLAALARRIEALGPAISRAYRLSGSSLALILDGPEAPDSPRLVEAIHAAASAPIAVDTSRVRVEPAIGVDRAAAAGQAGSAKERLRRARVAVHEAQELDKDWLSYDAVADTASRETFDLIGQVEAGLRGAEFEVHYQPKLALRDRQPVGVEALIRWRRADGGLVPPGAYMPKLEKTSLIHQVSRFVIQTAADYVRTGVLVPVGINLAPRNLADPGLIEALIETLEEGGVPGSSIEVEVTEAALMRQPENAIAMLRRLREHGIGVSIDDFGTGYSSFAYLRRLPATNLKIDREFVRHLDSDPRSRSLVWAMIECGHALEMTVTAEGVETAEQAQILAEYGCDVGQGFLWSAARPAAELGQWVAGLGKAPASGLSIPAGATP